MSFNQKNLDKAFNQTRDIFNIYVYKTEDTAAEVQTPGYFDEARFARTEPEDWANGLILCNTSDAYFEGFMDGSGAVNPAPTPDAKFLGEYATPAALEAAHPEALQVVGSTAAVVSTTTMWYIDTANTWQDSEVGYLGDMLAAVYDPTNVAGDAFSMGNMAETATAKVFSDVERTKLDGIEDGAEVNPDAAEVKTLYESNPDTNAFTDADESKLDGIEDGAEVNPDAAEIKTLYESNANTNAFTDAEQAAVAQNTSDITDLQNDKIDKPDPSGSFELDILRRDTTAGEFLYQTPVNGVVKVNTAVTGVAIASGVRYKIDNLAGTFSTVTSFPRNISNQFPGQDPITNPGTFFPFIYNSTDDKWLENEVHLQAHLWRIDVNYTRVGTQNNRELVFELENPLTGFTQALAFIMPNGPIFQTFETSFIVETIADSGSIGEGYEFYLTPVGESVTVDIDITRTSFEKI